MSVPRPFLEYAVQNILHHANEAAKAICQVTFLKKFPLKSYLQAYRRVSRSSLNRYTLDVPLVYILADNNSARLIRACGGEASAFVVSADRYRYPIFAALAKQHLDATHALLPHCDEAELDRAVSRLGINVSFSPPEDQTPFTWAVLAGHRSLAEILLEAPDVVLPRFTSQWASLLYKSSQRNCIDTVPLIIGRVADINATSGHFGNAFHVACERGHVKMMRLLLDAGADVNAVGGAGCALFIACTLHSPDPSVIRLLLDLNADVSVGRRNRGNGGGTLAVMSGRGDVQIVSQLLDRCVILDDKIGPYSDALKAACGNGHTAVVEMLLEKGSHLEYRSGIDYALYIAASAGHEAVMKLLLDAGANVNAYGGMDAIAVEATGRRGHTEIVKSLLKSRHADIGAHRHTAGVRPEAANNEHYQEIARLLHDHGPKDKEKARMLRATPQLESRPEPPLPKRQHRDINVAWAAEYWGEGPEAAQDYNREVGLGLIERNENANREYGSMISAIEVAAVHGHAHIVKMLLDKSAHDLSNLSSSHKSSACPPSQAAGHPERSAPVGGLGL